jgi:molybdopterin molybdotransferase
MLAIEDALKRLLADVKPIDRSETVVLMDAHRRILAQAQYSALNVPPADVSAMDGYAIALAQTQTNTYYAVSQRIAAGYPAEPLQANSVARIFTGSEIPTGADTVVIQENTATDNDAVSFLQLPEPGANIRRCGQDIVSGAALLPKGQRLLAQDLGLLASVGIESVPCFRRLKVGVLSSGDELLEPGQKPLPGKIYNSNRFTLKGLVNSVDMEFISLGHVADDFSATVAALQQAVDQVDLIVTTGGVSVGEEDHIKNAVESLGKINFWKLAIKPGKPLAYGSIRDVPLFGLPGNPVAVFVTFLMVVRPFLLKMQGASENIVEPLFLPCNFEVVKPSPRQEYRRVRVHNGSLTEYHTQDSGVLTSTHWANALAVVPANTSVSQGDLLQTYPFSFFNL